MVDAEKRIVAAVHAGWRGTALNISGKVLRLLSERYGTRPCDVRAAIGPAIGACCYEVDAAVYEAMEAHPARDEIFAPVTGPGVGMGRGTGKWKLNLALANRHQLQALGVPPANILAADICTSCTCERFYSHRKEGGTTGRLLNFIMLNDNILS